MTISDQHKIFGGGLMIFTMSRWLSFILLLALQAHADTLLGKVVGVADGDTIAIPDDTHIAGVEDVPYLPGHRRALVELGDIALCVLLP